MNDWCYHHEEFHGPMDYSDNCLTDLGIAEDNSAKTLARLLIGASSLIPGRRCPARLRRRDAGPDGHFGRCELKRHMPHIDHALERGMYWVRWAGEDAAVSGTWVTAS